MPSNGDDQGWCPSGSSSESGLPSPRRSRGRGRGTSRSTNRSKSRSWSRSTTRSAAGRQDRARMAEEVPPPAPLKGSQWWQQPLWTAAEHHRRQRPRHPVRALVHESLLSGLMTESWAFEALDIPVKVQVAVDKKLASWKWILQHRSKLCTHFFQNLDHAVCARGRLSRPLLQCKVSGFGQTGCAIDRRGVFTEPSTKATDHLAIKGQIVRSEMPLWTRLQSTLLMNTKVCNHLKSGLVYASGSRPPALAVVSPCRRKLRCCCNAGLRLVIRRLPRHGAGRR